MNFLLSRHRYLFVSDIGYAGTNTVGVLQRGWQVDLTAGKISFAKKTEEKVEIPKEKLISANLQYARELEQIV